MNRVCGVVLRRAVLVAGVASFAAGGAHAQPSSSALTEPQPPAPALMTERPGAVPSPATGEDALFAWWADRYARLLAFVRQLEQAREEEQALEFEALLDRSLRAQALLRSLEDRRR